MTISDRLQCSAIAASEALDTLNLIHSTTYCRAKASTTWVNDEGTARQVQHNRAGHYQPTPTSCDGYCNNSQSMQVAHGDWTVMRRMCWLAYESLSLP